MSEYKNKLDLCHIKEVISNIVSERDIKQVAFVGCGASMAELYPGKYFLANNTSKLNVQLYTANEFNYDPPEWLGENTLVVTCSMGGTTPETVKANLTAKNLGAPVVAVTRYIDSPLTKDADYVVTHAQEQNYAAKAEKMASVLAIAVEILNQIEGYEYYDQMLEAFDNVLPFSEKAALSAKNDAKEFASRYKDEKQIYFMASGASTKVAYSTSLFLIMEMQWLNSGNFNTGEFFHGPFELTDEKFNVVLLMSEGNTRQMDTRALTFLNRFNANATIIDVKDFGLSGLVGSEIVTYFCPILHTAVMRVYAEELSFARLHPLTKRRYMWKLSY